MDPDQMASSEPGDLDLQCFREKDKSGSAGLRLISQFYSFSLVLYVPVNNFSVMSGRVFLG